MRDVGLEGFQAAGRIIDKDLAEDGGKCFGVSFPKILKYPHWQQAVDETDALASEGKILIDFF